jgi:hypothetical protein
MVSKKRKPKATRDRNLERFVRKLGDEEIKTFLAVLGALMAQVPAPRDARKSYLKEVEVRLRSNGVDFLSKSRVFPTFGLKLLGNDRDGFPIPGFKQQKGKIYPSLFAWYWGELDRLSEVCNPTKSDVQRAQRILCVLSFAKMIKLNSVNQIRKSLSDFERRVDPSGSSQDKALMLDNYFRNLEQSVSITASNLGILTPEMKALMELAGYPTEPEKTDETPLGKFYRKEAPSLTEVLGVSPNLADVPKYLDLESISTKPCALADEPRFPHWFDHGGPADFGFKDPPYGRVHVLTESAGKLRIICPYNTPFVHSIGLYRRCRKFLRLLRGDYSENQAAGCRFVQREIAKGGGFCVSGDLSNFSDDIAPELAAFGLRQLGIKSAEKYLFNLPVSLPNGRFIIPNKLLMGLKGCFELSAVCHHYVTRLAGITRYAIVGDDIFFRGDLQTYENVLKISGWKLNRAKTIVSRSVAQFCGEMYWFGHTVSPCVPKVSSCFRNGRLLKAAVLFSVARCAVANLNQIYRRRSVVTVMLPIIRLLRSKWNSLIAFEAPQKLRGLGFKTSRPGVGLLRLLSRRDVLRMSKLSIGIKRERIEVTRWFGLPIQIAPSKCKQVLTYSPVLCYGAVQLKVPNSRPAVKKDVSSLQLFDVLEWYYNNQRLDLNQFKPRSHDAIPPSSV